jgi:c(7)-type cytochrome triheme protein
VTAALLVALVVGAAPPEPADQKGTPVHATVELHGRVVIDNYSSKVGVPAVTFDHWRHRAAYTCRGCHVDVGFALKAGETQMSAASNEAGQHCGVCHDGKTVRGGVTMLRACSGWPRPDPARGCTRCHTGPNPGAGAGYEDFKGSLPLDSSGAIDWEEATRRGLIKPSDLVEGVSANRAPMKLDKDVEIRPRGSWMNGVTFSHRKHVAWLGCELCHPDVFPLGKRGSITYTMSENRAGRYCGACHGSVAFSLASCDRCHMGENHRAVR